MPKNKDSNQSAISAIERLIGDTLAPAGNVPAEPDKNAAAVALGRLGGLKGGNARAAKLSKTQRSDIAKKAANARWGTSKTTLDAIKNPLLAKLLEKQLGLEKGTLKALAEKQKNK